jgi:uncharacterized membrane-anchored protein
VKWLSLESRTVLSALVVLDVVVFGGWIAREEVGRRIGTQVLLPIEGVDPRDLLSGHFVRIRLAAVREAHDLGGGLREARVEYCLEPRQDGRWHVSGRRESVGDACASFIAGRVDAAGWPDFGIDRFYVDEREQDAVRIDPSSDSYLVARLDRDGYLHPVDLVIRGRSLRKR